MGKRHCNCGAAKTDHHLMCEACWHKVPRRLRDEYWEFPAHRQRRATRKSIKAALRNVQGQRSFLFV